MKVWRKVLFQSLTKTMSEQKLNSERLYMKSIIKNLVIKSSILLDIIISPIILFSSSIFLFIRKIGIQHFILTKKIMMFVGVFPIRDHYYEPLFNAKHLRYALDEERTLPGINFNEDEQIEILNKFKYNEELKSFPLEDRDQIEYYYHNMNFSAGDSEYLYNIIRFFKPKKIIEIGSGHSTLMAINAINKNKEENKRYKNMHICIEPFEMPWLNQLNIEVIREKVEDIDKKIFKQLAKNDILFIDSSHVIRPQGDVLFEYLEILPILKSGVIVHIHDIFTPRDYSHKLIVEEVTLWNEQYLLEAFLSFNTEYKIIGAVNYLKHNHFTELSSKCPILKKEPYREPGSFWIQKV